METKTKDKIEIFLLLTGFLAEAFLVSLIFIAPSFSPATPVPDLAVKGISTGIYDSFVNYSFALFVLAANVIAISLIFKHVINKK